MVVARTRSLALAALRRDRTCARRRERMSRATGSVKNEDVAELSVAADVDAEDVDADEEIDPETYSTDGI